MQDNITPTEELAQCLVRAFSWYNEHLFDSELPHCLISTHRTRPSIFGHYIAEKVIRADRSEQAAEISLNQYYFSIRSFEDTLADLVHNMVHHWQECFGEGSRSGYHNRQWADKMESIGLYPSDTGLEYGKRTGQKMRHYAVGGGPFDVATRQLLDSGFCIEWGDFIIPEADKDDEEKEQKPKKIKYTCPDCGVEASALPGLCFACGPCGVYMEDPDGNTNAADEEIADEGQEGDAQDEDEAFTSPPETPDNEVYGHV